MVTSFAGITAYAAPGDETLPTVTTVIVEGTPPPPVTEPTAPTETFVDSVSYYNMQIDAWEQHLENNEKAKVQAINNRDKWLVQNKSIDGGSTTSIALPSMS